MTVQLHSSMRTNPALNGGALAIALISTLAFVVRITVA